VAGLYLLIAFSTIFVYVFLSIKIAASARKFVRYSDAPTIAFFGDSTAYGVGSSCPEKSLPGLVALKNPKYTIINDSKNGSYIRNVTSVLSHQKVFDILFVCCGGIDILRMRNEKVIKNDLRELFEEMIKKSKKSIFVTPLNLGFSSAFP
jgi:lysophospholipase L1-like esterase